MEIKKRALRRFIKLSQNGAVQHWLESLFSSGGNTKQDPSRELIKSGWIRSWKLLHARKSLLANAPLSVLPQPESSLHKPAATWKFLSSSERLQNQASTASELFPTVVLADDQFVYCGSAIYAGVPADPTILYPENRPIRIWDRNSREMVQSIDAHLGAVNDMILHGDWLVSASYDRTLKGYIRSPDPGGPPYQYKFTAYGHSRSVSAVKVVSSDDSGLVLLSGSKDHTVRLFKVDFEAIKENSSTAADVMCVLANDVRDVAIVGGTLALVGCGEHSAILLDTETKTQIRSYDTSKSVLCVGSNPLMPNLATVGCDNSLVDIDIRTHKIVKKFEKKNFMPRQIHVDEDRKICADSTNGAVHVVDQSTNKRVTKFAAHKNRVAFWVDSSVESMITCGSDKVLKEWRFPSAESIVKTAADPAASASTRDAPEGAVHSPAWLKKSFQRRYTASDAKNGLKNNSIVYSKSHLWLKAETDAETPSLHIGVSNALKDRLGLVASVQLAGEIGLTMPRGALIGIITHATGGNENQADTDMDEIAGSLRQTEITAPVTGEIVAINEDIERDAEVFLSFQPEQSWLYKLKLTEEHRNLDDVMDAEEYRQYLNKIGWL